MAKMNMKAQSFKLPDEVIDEVDKKSEIKKITKSRNYPNKKIFSSNSIMEMSSRQVDRSYNGTPVVNKTTSNIVLNPDLIKFVNNFTATKPEKTHRRSKTNVTPDLISQKTKWNPKIISAPISPVRQKSSNFIIQSQDDTKTKRKQIMHYMIQ